MSGPDTRVDGHPTWNPLTVEELREQCIDRNLKIVSSMWSSEYDDDLMQITLNDAADGFSTYPELLTVVHLRTVSLARRFPVREERSKGWRPAGEVNHTTLSSDRARHDGIRDLASGALLFLRQGIVPKFGKRDVKSAYRRAPIRRSDEEFSLFVFVWRGPLWVARHHGMMFRATKANAAWHRLGSFVSYYIVIKFKAFLLRYVDDYFGASRVMVTGGTLLTDILELLGLCTDSTKDNDTLSLPVLGSLVTVHLKHRSVTTQVVLQKAAKWADLLEQQRLQSEN